MNKSFLIIGAYLMCGGMINNQNDEVTKTYSGSEYIANSPILPGDDIKNKVVLDQSVKSDQLDRINALFALHGCLRQGDIDCLQKKSDIVAIKFDLDCVILSNSTFVDDVMDILGIKDE